MKIILLVVFLGIPCATNLVAYGERIGLPEETFVTADFIDHDGDGTDDRYQKKPTRSVGEAPPRLLPQVDYLGGCSPKETADLRLGALIYGEWWKSTKSLPSKLSPFRHIVFPGHPNLDKFLRGDVEGLKFTFADGTIVYFSRETGYTVIFSRGKYQAFGWTGEKLN